MKYTEVDLDDYKGQYLVMLFYPWDFPYKKPIGLIEFSENMHRFSEINTNVVGISSDSHYTHKEFVKMSREDGGLGGINFPLIGDIDQRVSKAYGVHLNV